MIWTKIGDLDLIDFNIIFFSKILIYISQTNIYINTLKKEKKKKSYNL